MESHGKPRRGVRAAKKIATLNPRYQPLPDLLPEEFAALKADIAAKGVLYPVLQDERGNTIDGHQRERAAKELGIKYPIAVLPGLTEEDKWHLALSLNIKRRHLTRAQMRAIIEEEIKRTPDLTNNWLAEILGVDHKTVLAARRKLEATWEIPKLPKLRGKDGKNRITAYRQVVANSASELRVAQAVASKLPSSCNGKMLDTTTASRRVRRQIQEKAWDGKIARPLATDSIRLYHCRFQELRETAGLRSKSVHLILTDIPYGKEFLAELDDLGRFAKEVLVEGGLFITFSGQYYLDQCFRIFGEHLTYRWTLASVWERDANVIHPLAIMSRWKPILLYSKGAYRRTTGRRSDLLNMIHKEKELHDWQQPVTNIEELVKNFSDPGQLVVDPCGGSFTTALACHNLSRRFVGCDVDQDCVRRGQERLAAAFAGRRKGKK
jgi:site-specific DNA-methyltransferase (adenine-specific)